MGNTEKAMLRALQAFIFMITIVFADALIDFQEWKDHFIWTLAEVMVYVVLTLILSKFLSQQVPLFLALMACPPHVNEENMSLLFDVLFNDHALYSDHHHIAPVGDDVRVCALVDGEPAMAHPPTAQRSTDDAPTRMVSSNSFQSDPGPGSRGHTATPGPLARGPGLMRRRRPRTYSVDLTRADHQAVVNASSGVAMELAEILGLREKLATRLQELGYHEPERLPPATSAEARDHKLPIVMMTYRV